MRRDSPPAQAANGSSISLTSRPMLEAMRIPSRTSSCRRRMSVSRITLPIHARSLGRQSACSTKIGSSLFAALIRRSFVFFERLIIPRFRLIARSSRGTLLEDLCNRLTIDDGIHHSAGVAYERVLLEGASKQTKDRLIKAANRLLPIFVEHALWRPKERAWIGGVMRETDIRRLQDDVRDGIRMASSMGLDVSDIELPFAA